MLEYLVELPGVVDSVNIISISLSFELPACKHDKATTVSRGATPAPRQYAACNMSLSKSSGCIIDM